LWESFDVSIVGPVFFDSAGRFRAGGLSVAMKKSPLVARFRSPLLAS